MEGKQGKIPLPAPDIAVSTVPVSSPPGDPGGRSEIHDPRGDARP